MEKRGVILIVIIIVIVISSSLYIYQNRKVNYGEFECEEDSDCVPSTCCHPDSCVFVGKEEDCSSVFCTQECKPGTLDCGQGFCGCVNGKCGAVFNE